jgi:3-hydroxy-9,10-secoandrosta-1,3,5(10)-triene-9,17-dione monooxygenase reductase component
MTFDSRQFRSALGGFPTGVAVVTARADDGKPIGITINSFSSVSLDPPLVLWSLARGSLNLPHFAVGRRHIIHVLADHQDELAKRFASRAPDKFSGLSHETTEDNIPLFDECVATFGCATRALYEEGDHVIVIAHVEQIDQREREPLLFWGGKFALLETAASSRG